MVSCNWSTTVLYNKQADFISEAPLFGEERKKRREEEEERGRRGERKRRREEEEERGRGGEGDLRGGGRRVFRELQTGGVEGGAGESGVLSHGVGTRRNEGRGTGGGGRGWRERVHRSCRRERRRGGEEREVLNWNVEEGENLPDVMFLLTGGGGGVASP